MEFATRGKQSRLPRAIVAASLSLAVAGTFLAIPNNALAVSGNGPAFGEISAIAKGEKSATSYLDNQSITASPDNLRENFENGLESYKDFKYEVADISDPSVSCYEINEGGARVGRLYFGTWDESLAPSDMDTVGIDLNMTLALDRVNPNAEVHSANVFSSLIMACDPTLTSSEAQEVAQEAYAQGWSIRNGLKYIHAVDDEYVWLKMEIDHGVEPKWVVWYPKERTVFHGLSMEVSPEAEFDLNKDRFVDTINGDIVYRIDFQDDYYASTSGINWDKVEEIDAESLNDLTGDLDGYTLFGSERISNKDLDVFVDYYYSDADPSWYAMVIFVRSEDRAWLFTASAASVSNDDQGIIDVIRQFAHGLTVGDLKDDKGTLLA